jgi:glycosyltransferase involved in cell wall biosynthesis
MSNDGTRKVLQEYATRHSFISIVDNPRRIKPVALNLGIRAAAGADVIMRIDAHAWYPSNYISGLVNGLVKYGADSIGGVRRTFEGTRLTEQAIGVVVSHPFAAGNATFRVGTPSVREVDSVFPGCYPRSVFERIGLFNERLIRAQDREFSFRLRAAGGKIILDPSVECVYFPRTDLSAYARWTAIGGFWVFAAQRFSPIRLVSFRNWVPPAFVLLHFLVLALLFSIPPVAAVAGLPLCVYWALVFWFSASAGRKRGRWSLAGVLLFLFPLTHYAYGLGGLAGFCCWITSRGRIDSDVAAPAGDLTISV